MGSSVAFFIGPKGYIQVDSEVDPRGRRQWRLERMDLPASIASYTVMLFTATFSTGERERKAIEALVGLGVLENNVTLVAIVCASDGVVALCSRFPRTYVYTIRVPNARVLQSLIQQSARLWMGRTSHRDGSD
jgi:hypothetical protein